MGKGCGSVGSEGCISESGRPGLRTHKKHTHWQESQVYSLPATWVESGLTL